MTTPLSFSTRCRAFHLIRVGLGQGAPVDLLYTQQQPFSIKPASNRQCTDFSLYVFIDNCYEPLGFTNRTRFVCLGYLENAALTKMVTAASCKVRITEHAEAYAAHMRHIYSSGISPRTLTPPSKVVSAWQAHVVLTRVRLKLDGG